MTGPTGRCRRAPTRCPRAGRELTDEESATVRELIVRVEETAEEIGVQVVGKKQQYKPGDRVRMLSSGGQTQVSHAPR